MKHERMWYHIDLDTVSNPWWILAVILLVGAMASLALPKPANTVVFCLLVAASYGALWFAVEPRTEEKKEGDG